MSEHPFVHIEISAQDPAAASKFYSDLFGWKVEVDPKFDYHMFNPGSGLAGAFVGTVGPGSDMYKPGDIVPYVGTDDIDATLRKVESLGGKVLLPKTEIEGMGWFAFFADPTGNRMGLFTEKQR